MAMVNISIPLKTAHGDGFYQAKGVAPKNLFGYRLGLKIDNPYLYLVLENVPSEVAAEVLEKVRALLPWAAVRLDFGILAAKGDLRFTDAAIFDGQFPVAHGPDITPSPIRIESNHKTEEADALLFSALVEGSELDAFDPLKLRKKFRLACEIFASVDFEASANAQFLALISILEILADPAPRPGQCISIIEDAMTRMKDEAKAAGDTLIRQALEDMHRGAEHWKKESIRSSIRRLGTDVSRKMGDADPAAVGRAAVNLYDKRSLVVHEGVGASLRDVADTRKIVREAIAVEADCFEHIRGRFPLA
ncbi:hypothetical protein I6F18_18930 [Bradyrhizobium sp. NBAIM32]|uniref:hypothetical protein n=1 Tax=Bradyrhizobium sp. NBAIM32 TaxID=2793809 RepID=UPI001CD70AE2|nr:hypothetical protein [Bradyrhizobium sp. NBAIM32]MCA1542035.1 hypothetical protein [Bradyrhizobium sp. NBAIM32]